MQPDLFPTLRQCVETLTGEFHTIPEDRRKKILPLSDYFRQGIPAKQPVRLTFICTHNSRRSHIAQIWAQTAAYVYGVPNIFCYSGGTEATAFNPRAVKAMRDAGFSIEIEKDSSNPLYKVSFAREAPPVKVFSKVFDDPVNPAKEFVAVMTCSHADENCPFIPGADVRIPLTYDDPKDFDNTAMEEEKYSERVREIGREVLFAFNEFQFPRT